MSIFKKSFEKIIDGKKVDLYTLKNNNDVTLKITNYGAIIVTLTIPDKHGHFEDVVLGYDTLQEYQQDQYFFGAIVGRYANRIANGKFVLDGREYLLQCNDGNHHLHGGYKGFSKQVWNVDDVSESKIIMSYLSPDGDEGYPGNLLCQVTYSLSDKNELIIKYQAETDQATLVNFSHHSYFNLAGQGNGLILDHLLQINAEYFTEVDTKLIPTGKILSVSGTALDFRNPTNIHTNIHKLSNGFDHNYILNNSTNSCISVVVISEKKSGRNMEVFTTQPGVQFYSGFYLDSIKGKSNSVYNRFSGFCIETQHYPDSPNRPEFPPVILQAGNIYKHAAIYKFSTL